MRRHVRSCHPRRGRSLQPPLLVILLGTSLICWLHSYKGTLAVAVVLRDPTRPNSDHREPHRRSDSEQPAQRPDGAPAPDDRKSADAGSADRYPRSFRIFDILLYHNEAYMLYIRLRTLRRYVDIHYIGFALLSFSHNVAAELTFDPFEKEIRELSHRYYWFNYTHPSRFPGPWEREEDIRLRLIERMIAVENPQYDDLVIWSDLDETPWPKGMEWVIEHPPSHYYRFLGFMFFYNYRWRSPDPWQWAYIMKYGAKQSDRNWFQYRSPDRPPFEYVFGFSGWEDGSQSLYHCSYCFPSMQQIIAKLRSFSHEEFALGRYVDPNYIYAHVYCGHSLFKGSYTPVEFQSMGIDIPEGDHRFDYLKMRLSFNDLDTYQFNITRMKQYAPCELDFLKGKTELPDHLPNHIR